MAKSSFRCDPASEQPEYPDLDRGRRACLARLGAAGALLLALGGRAEAGELPGKKEKGKKKKKKEPKPPPARPGGPAYPPSQLDTRVEELGEKPKDRKKKDDKKKKDDNKKKDDKKRPVLPPPGVPPQPRSQLDELLD
jgi:hypothetical protein